MFDKNKKPSGLNAIVAQVRESNAPLAKLQHVVATGADVQSDAQKLLFFLASYGEGDRVGKYAFESAELVGSVDGGAAGGYAEGLKELGGMTGSRLSDAGNYLAGKGYAKLTHDGEYGKECGFHEVALTDTGRAAAQGVVKRASGGGSGFDLFGDMGPPAAVVVAEREQLTAMLARARVGFSVASAEDTMEVVLDKGVAFTFDAEGKLLGFSVGRRDATDEDVSP